MAKISQIKIGETSYDLNCKKLGNHNNNYLANCPTLGTNVNLEVQANKSSTISSTSTTSQYPTAKSVLSAVLSCYKFTDTYQAVEYIESTGTQHIDTKFRPNNNTRVLMQYSVNSAPGVLALFGARDGTTSNNFNVWLDGLTCIKPQYYNNDYNSKSVSYTYAANQKVIVDFNKNICNFGTASQTFTNTTFQGNYTIALFTVNSGGTIDSRKASVKMYSCQIWDNETLVRNFIPCYRKSDNVIGMFDAKNGLFYTNGGTGTFNKGANITI